MFTSSIHFYISFTVFDNSGCEWFTIYSSDHKPILYLFCRSFENVVPISWLHTTPLCGVTGLLKVISHFMSSLNPLIFFALRCIEKYRGSSCRGHAWLCILRISLVDSLIKSHIISWCIQSCISMLVCLQFSACNIQI